MPVFILCPRYACYFSPGLHSDLTPLCLPHQRRGKTSPVKTPVQLSRRKRGSQSQPPIFRPPETGSLTQQEAARSLPTAVASWGRGGEQCTGRIRDCGLAATARPAVTRTGFISGGMDAGRAARGLAGVPALATCHPSRKTETRQLN